MSRSARSVHAFGLYLVAVGLTALAVPNLLFRLVDVPATEEPWIRILGVVVVVLGSYYLVAARNDMVPLFRATVGGRLVAGVALVLIVGTWGYWLAVVFGVVDVAGAIWTWTALRRDDDEASHPTLTAARSTS